MASVPLALVSRLSFVSALAPRRVSLARDGRVPAPAFRRPVLVRCKGGGGGSRPGWTEAAAGIGRGRTKGEPRSGDAKPRGGKGTGGEGGEGKAGRGGGAPPKPGPGEDFSRKRRKQREAAATANGGRGGRGDTATRGGRGGKGRDRAERYASLQDAYRSKATNARPSKRFTPDDSTPSVRHYEGPVANAPRSDAAVTARNCDALRSHYDRTLNPNPKPRYTGDGFRLVRCMPHLKRREADEAVSAGRVRVNDSLVKPSLRVRAGDVVTLDGKVLDWEPFAAATEGAIAAATCLNGENGFVYLAYNKPRGVTCTMESSQRSSMMYSLKDELKLLGSIPNASTLRNKGHGSGTSVRVFPVGRLDRDSSGLVVLTDDGRVPEALLDPSRKAPKTYEVDVTPAPSTSAIEKLRAGVVITTTQQRDGETTTGPTLPCSVDIIRKRGDGKFATLRFELREGRNRQIRKMCDAVGVDVTRLHRVSVGEVSLDESSLEVGGVRALSGAELDAIGAAVLASKSGDGRGGGSPRVGRVGGGEWGNTSTRGGGGWGAEIAAERGKY